MPKVVRVNSTDTQVSMKNQDSSGEHSKLIGIQSASISTQKDFTELPELGKFGTQDRILNSNQTTNLNLDFILKSDKSNDPFFGNTSNGFLSTDKFTFKVKDLAGSNTVNNAYLSSYSLDFSVGEVPKGSLQFEADTVIFDSAEFLTDQDQGSESITALNPNQIRVTTDFDEGISTDLPVQSVSFQVSLERENITRIGERVPQYRYPDPNGNGAISFSVLKNDITGLDLTNLVLEKGQLNILFNDAGETDFKSFPIYDCSLVSVDETANLDQNTTLDFNYIFGIKRNNQTFNV